MPAQLNGIVVVDKPDGLTSARVVSRIKTLFGAKKVGHTGTLDPFATGVLICCLNRATRLAQFFLKGDKTYEAVMQLGTQTDTQDATGSVIDRQPVAALSERMIVRTAQQFVGDIKQVPPIFSALKHKGRPLYALARRGQAVEKPARKVRIDRLDIIDVSLPEVRFSVSCSSGTYIRALCADMGSALGCGGHLKALRRTESSGFTADRAVSLDSLSRLREKDRLADAVIGMNEALHFIPETIADEALTRKILNGKRLSASDFKHPPIASGRGVFKVIDTAGSLIAVLADAESADHYIYCCVFST